MPQKARARVFGVLKHQLQTAIVESYLREGVLITVGTNTEMQIVIAQSFVDWSLGGPFCELCIP